MSFLDKFRSVSPVRRRLGAAEKELDHCHDPRRREVLRHEIEELRIDADFEDLAETDPQGSAIIAALAQLKEVNALLSSQRGLAMNVEMIIEVAIHHGAPVYNAGSHIGCAFIYDCAARMILRMLEGPDAAAGTLLQIADRFRRVSFTPITTAIADRRAWDLRHAFDDTLAILRPEPPPVTENPPSSGLASHARVFISHAKDDADVANSLVTMLERAGIPCWIAPRDIPGGTSYVESIADAIESSKICLILLSSRSNASQFVAREVERAVTYNKQTIPVRLEDVRPARSIELLLGAIQWIDLWGGSASQEANMHKLLDRLRAEFPRDMS